MAVTLINKTKFFFITSFIDFLPGINESVSELVVDSAVMEWWSLFLFATKSMLAIVAYTTILSSGGITQYALPVHYEALRFSTPVALAQKRAATWEQVSPNPAIQSQ